MPRYELWSWKIEAKGILCRVQTVAGGDSKGKEVCKAKLLSCNVLALQDNVVNLWWSDNGQRGGTFNGHNGSVWTIDMSCAFVELAAACIEAVGCCFTASMHSCATSVKQCCWPGSEFSSIFPSPLTANPDDSTRLLTAGGDSTVRLWDLRTGEELYRFAYEGDNAPFRAVKFRCTVHS